MEDKSVDYNKIKEILSIVKSKIEAHTEFKKEYNKQLAFDFNLFNFFNVGENKVSEILAFFLNPKESHGQGNIFLKEFVTAFYKEDVDLSNAYIECEKIITNKRRIDLYIKLKDFTIAIENKIWADDQPNQLKDYATFLEKETKGNFLLLYLNPYGSIPTEKSIDNEYKEKLFSKEQYKKISYKNDILILIDKWSAICEADNVTFFIKEFKKYLKIKFLGNNTINMSAKLREIIKNNQVEVTALVKEYNTIGDEIVSKLNEVGKELDKRNPILNEDLSLSKSGLFNWYGTRVYKYSISKGTNKIWIQLFREDIFLYSNYYFQDGTDEKFKEITKELELNDRLEVDHKKSKSELIAIFLEQVEKTNEIFKEYDKFTNE